MPFTPSGQTLLGTAAHCVDHVGQGVRDIDGVQFGTAAFIGSADTTATDFAFVAVDPEDVGRLSAAVKGWPAYPTGSTVPTDTATGVTLRTV